MPYINVSTSAKVKDKKKLLEDIAILVSSLTNKSKRFVMAKLVDNSEMYFEDQSPCCFVEVKSIGSLNTPLMSQSICSFVYEKIGIPIDKIYICFEDVPSEMWGWNGKTFG